MLQHVLPGCTSLFLGIGIVSAAGVSNLTQLFSAENSLRNEVSCQTACLPPVTVSLACPIRHSHTTAHCRQPPLLRGLVSAAHCVCLQGQGKGVRPAEKCGMCLHCVRPALRKGCLNPILRPEGPGDAPELASKCAGALPDQALSTLLCSAAPRAAGA